MADPVDIPGVRWFARPEEHTGPLAPLIDACRARRPDDPPPPADVIAPWTLVSSTGPRLVCRRALGDDMLYFKWDL